MSAEDPDYYGKYKDEGGNPLPMPYGIGRNEAGKWMLLGRENLREIFRQAGSIFKESHFSPVVYAFIKEIEDMVALFETILEDGCVREDERERVMHFVEKYKGERISHVDE